MFGIKRIAKERRSFPKRYTQCNSVKLTQCNSVVKMSSQRLMNH